jgi:hypothetical protein
MSDRIIAGPLSYVAAAAGFWHEHPIIARTSAFVIIVAPVAIGVAAMVAP